MAVAATPPNRNTTGGARLINALNGLESGINATLKEISTTMETIDGGEPNATDPTKMGKVQSTYGYADNNACVAAIAQLQAVRGPLVANLAAFQQAFDRLRG